MIKNMNGIEFADPLSEITKQVKIDMKIIKEQWKECNIILVVKHLIKKHTNK